MRFRLGLLALAAFLLLSGCTAPGATDGQAAHGPTAAPPAATPPSADGTTVEATRVVPHVHPIDVAGHLKPVPCVGVNRHCDAGADVQPPGQPSVASAGLEWTTLSQAFTDRDGLFWRIRLDGTWTSSTPAVAGVTLLVGTRPASCGTCEPRLAFAQDSEGSRITVERTDVFLHAGEDTLVYRAEPHGVGGKTIRPADDVRVELRGWAAAFVADGEPILLTP